MKKLLLALFSLCALNCNAQHLYGDVNHDGKISVADVDMLVNIVLGRQEAEEIKIEDLLPKTYTINGVEYPMPEAVDLGLPSGTKWASMNIGAYKEEDNGLFFAWGDINGHSEDLSDGHKFNWDSYIYGNSYYTITKYNYDDKYGIVDNKMILDDEDDAAHVYLKNGWEMPTAEQISELCNSEYCKWELDVDRLGYIVTSKIQGYEDSQLFLPSSPEIIDNKVIHFINEFDYEGTFWGKTLCVYNDKCSCDADVLYYLRLDRTGSLSGVTRFVGLCIRPVTK